jgi:hypothetical protein
MTGPASVDADQLHAVEVAVSYRFANDLLAVYAAAIPTLLSDYQFDLHRVVAHTGELRSRKAPGDLIGLGKEEEEDVILALSLRAAEVEETILYRVDDRGDGQRWQSLEAWVIDLAKGSSTEAPAFRPQLLRAPPGGSTGRRVRHKTFGEGRVFLDTGSGAERKLKVDFEKVGLKTLLARFVEFIDE